MNPWLVRHFSYPLYERLLGRRTFHLLNELEGSQWLGPDLLRSLQATKLRRLLREVSTGWPVYREYAETDLGDDLPTLLRRLPLSDKGSIRKSERDRHGGRRIRGVRRMSTGGSTGEPLTFHVDRTREAYDKAARMRSYRWFGVQPGDREVYIWGVPDRHRRQDRLRAIRDVFHNHLLLSAFDLSHDAMRGYLRRMETYKPACVFGYPSSIVKLCDFAKAEGIDLRFDLLKAVFVTGEVLDDQQRGVIESYFRVPVANGYGGRDSGFCAHQCPHGSMHVTSEHVIMEIVDQTGAPVPSGQSGEIVITNLDNLATPFIRYRTGDIGRLRDGACRCGRGLELMDVISGRRTDHLVSDDGTHRHALSLIYELRDIDAIRQFQVHQARNRSVDVRVVADRTLTATDRERVLEGVRACVGDKLDASLRVVDHIEASPSGKFRHVISEADAAPSN